MNLQTTTDQHKLQLDMQYLKLLSNSFPTIAAAATEIINLEAIMNLPKGTEHFLADLHGESEAFLHVLKNASGNIKRKVTELFAGDIRDKERRELCTLIYYPEQKIELIKAAETDIEDWYHITIHRLVAVCRDVSSKYTRSKVRKALPEDFGYIIEELLHERTDDTDKAAYVSVIVDTIISTGRADDFIIALCNVIQRLAIDQLHILGDIYDRGSGAHIILDTMRQYHSWISSGATTTFCGWEPVPATMPASAMCCDSHSAMPISPHWRRAMASTSCHWPPLLWIPMATIPARSSFPDC